MAQKNKRRRKQKRITDGQKLLAVAIGSFRNTKTELAESLGMSLSQLRHLETGRRRPLLPVAVVLEEKLGIPVRAWQ